MTDQPNEGPSWFNLAAKSSVINALWLGPLNMFFCFKSGRFEDPYYLGLAQAEGVDIDTVIGAVLALEMMLMFLSLFAVFAAFHASKARPTIFTFITFAILATVLWTGLSYWLEL